MKNIIYYFYLHHYPFFSPKTEPWKGSSYLQREAYGLGEPYKLQGSPHRHHYG